MKKALFIFLSEALGNILAANAQYYNTTGKHLYYETHNSRNNITRQSLSFVKQTEAENDTLHITLADSVLPLNEEKKGFMSRQKIAYTQDNTIVYMMDETHSVFAVGAGGVTRLKNQDTGKIERIYNYKYPYEYIDRFDEILKRKDLIKEFYIK